MFNETTANIKCDSRYYSPSGNNGLSSSKSSSVPYWKRVQTMSFSLPIPYFIVLRKTEHIFHSGCINLRIWMKNSGTFGGYRYSGADITYLWVGAFLCLRYKFQCIYLVEWGALFSATASININNYIRGFGAWWAKLCAPAHPSPNQLPSCRCLDKSSLPWAGSP